MVRVVIWVGRAGRGFGPVGMLIGTALMVGAGFLTGKATNTKDKKKGWFI